MAEEKGEKLDLVQELRGVFNLFDRDGDGTISAEELEEKLRAVYGKKFKFQSREIRTMIKAVDADGNGTIDFDEFLSMMGVDRKRGTRRVGARDGRSELKEAFDVFDADGDGSITKVEVARVMSAVGIDIDAKTLDLMVRVVDTDGNGEIDFDEFVALMSDAPAKKSRK